MAKGTHLNIDNGPFQEAQNEGSAIVNQLESSRKSTEP